MLSPKQRQIMAFSRTGYQALICDGAIRSGKTSIMFIAFVDWLMREFSGQKLLLVGYTQSAIERNVLDPALETAALKKRYEMRYSSSTGELHIARGERHNVVHVFGADNKRAFRKIQGITAAGCFVDEVALCDPEAVKQAMARCSVEGSRYWFNCNPAEPTHWFNQEWILNARAMNALHLHFTLDDNPSLSDEVKERYKRQYHGVFRQRYVDGLWVVAEGLVYQIDQADYVITPEKAEGEGDGVWYLSCDYGITNPFAVGLWRVTRNVAYMVDEYYFDSRKEGRRLTDSEHCDNVEQLAEGRNIDTFVVDPSASSLIEELERRGKWDVLRANNDVLAGIQTVDQMLYSGNIKVSSKCTNLIAEMGMYRWDESNQAITRPIKEWDHCEDMLRYLAHTVLRFELEGWN